ncbi:integrase core domain protein [Teladorsagia circumcincta]|uniref:Integrase core domain protein n=1 Tax=Teladorsagia circumcincta TaxID=45464 RepID=A0A2G9UEQ5_TELCI|nr:integrase core domain protein [Teladorsagia circumcincta]
MPVICALSVIMDEVLLRAAYTSEYRKTSEFGNADGLSRLPDPRELPSPQMVVNEVKKKQMTAETWKGMILNEQQVAKATQEDEILKVFKYVMEGWPPRVKEEELKPYEKRKTEINGYTEKGTSLRNLCNLGNEMVKTLLHPWDTPGKVWQRLHMDFAETTDRRRWLVMVDAKSKWREVVQMKSTTVEKTMEKLKDIFSIHGLPEQMVVDNGPQLIAKDFKEYCIRRNIELISIPPYHHNSNGEAERFVQTFKKGYNKGKKSGKTTEARVRDQLFEYRITEHPAIGSSPAEMSMGRS